MPDAAFVCPISDFSEVMLMLRASTGPSVCAGCCDAGQIRQGPRREAYQFRVLRQRQPCWPRILLPSMRDGSFRPEFRQAGLQLHPCHR
ncbi:unnamed protein product, partial [Mesorhabditis spiculigera]